MKAVGPGNSQRAALVQLPPTDHQRKTARSDGPENNQTKTTPFMPLQSAGDADASSSDPRAPAAGGLGYGYQPAAGLSGDESRSSGAKTKDGRVLGGICIDGDSRPRLSLPPLAPGGIARDLGGVRPK
jgi:hypothetical protein